MLNFTGVVKCLLYLRMKIPSLQHPASNMPSEMDSDPILNKKVREDFQKAAAF